MKQFLLTLDDTLLLAAERQAQKAGKPLSAIVTDFLSQYSAGEDDFESLEKEEQSLRKRLKLRGHCFSAADRLNREDLHDRHALR